MSEKIDLSSLDPTRDSERFTAIARSIARDAIAVRERERGTRSLFAPVIARSRLTLAAAAAVMLVAGSTLAIVPASAPTAAADSPGSLAESAGIPASLVDLATTGRALTNAELLGAFQAVAASTAPR